MKVVTQILCSSGKSNFSHVSTPLPSNEGRDLFLESQIEAIHAVSTPLPSNEGRDLFLESQIEAIHAVSTPLPSNEGRDAKGGKLGSRGSLFQHLYLLMKVVTPSI